MRLIAHGLAACWFGPLVGLVAIVFIVLVPTLNACYGLAERSSFPYPSDPQCHSEPLLFANDGTRLAPLVLAVAVVLALQLLSSGPRYLIAVGLGTTALWPLATFFVLISGVQSGGWIINHGLVLIASWVPDVVVSLMLPSGLLPLLAGLTGVRRARPQAS